MNRKRIEIAIIILKDFYSLQYSCLYKKYKILSFVEKFGLLFNSFINRLTTTVVENILHL